MLLSENMHTEIESNAVEILQNRIKIELIN